MALNLRPLTPAIGIEATGIDLADLLDDTVFQSLYDAFAKHSVLLIRNQKLTPTQHVTFAKRFGELDSHVLAENMLDGQPEIFVVSNIKENGKNIGREKAGWFWHSDFSYQEIPAQASIMHAIEVPEAGGDTMFASNGEAYDGLSKKMQDFLEEVNAIHDFRMGIQRYTQYNNTAQPINEQVYKDRPPVSHPVVRNHPDTMRKTLFANPGYTSHFEGLTRAESDNLLKFLHRHGTQPHFVYRHKWQPGDILCWDNRGAWHCAIGDYDDDDRRLMHRVTVKGQPC